MGMDQEMLNEFGTAMRRAKSLISLHLSGNPGDCEEVRVAICERARVKPYEEPFVPDFNQKNNLEYNEGKVKQQDFRLEESITIGAQNKETVKTIND